MVEVAEIANKKIYRTLALEGVIFSDGFFKTFQVACLRMAEAASGEFTMLLEY